MNYLAHIYLSGNDNELKIGNFIADSVKGKQYLSFPEKIKQGILLHREIDTFTDAHPLVRKGTARLMPNYGLYSGVIVDILYDHLLAKNWKEYCSQDLEKYVAEFYELLTENYSVLPKRVKNFLPYMLQQNWLTSYASLSGIETILFQMNHRVKNGVKLHLALHEFQEFHSEFETEFRMFFEELESYVLKLRSEI